MTLEIGQPNTRTAGMVREPEGEWRYPSLQDQIDMLTKRVESLEAFRDAQRDRLRLGGSVMGRHK